MFHLHPGLFEYSNICTRRSTFFSQLKITLINLLFSFSPRMCSKVFANASTGASIAPEQMSNKRPGAP